MLSITNQQSPMLYNRKSPIINQQSSMFLSFNRQSQINNQQS
jgi:hypothetical protein